MAIVLFGGTFDKISEDVRTVSHLTLVSQLTWAGQRPSAWSRSCFLRFHPVQKDDLIFRFPEFSGRVLIGAGR